MHAKPAVRCILLQWGLTISVKTSSAPLLARDASERVGQVSIDIWGDRQKLLSQFKFLSSLIKSHNFVDAEHNRILTTGSFAVFELKKSSLMTSKFSNKYTKVLLLCLTVLSVLLCISENWTPLDRRVKQLRCF